jgi:hypothetical protein
MLTAAFYNLVAYGRLRRVLVRFGKMLRQILCMYVTTLVELVLLFIHNSVAAKLRIEMRGDAPLC